MIFWVTETGQPVVEKRAIGEGVFVANWCKASNAGCRICRSLLQCHQQRGSMARRVLLSEGNSQVWGFGATDGLDRLQIRIKGWRWDQR